MQDNKSNLPEFPITFGRRWKPLPWLFLLSPIYWFFSRLHRTYMEWTFPGFPTAPTIPLVVIGALRAGGSGKTSMTLALAQVFADRGLNVAILAYHLGKRSRTRGLGWLGKSQASDLTEVEENADWRQFSDEAVMLKQMLPCRVFVTRNRAKAWIQLHQKSIYQVRPFDLILSDDGFQDPRLKGAFRVLLQAPKEKPGIFDLLPAGPFRGTWRDGLGADYTLLGPIHENKVPVELPAQSQGEYFYRTLSFSQVVDKSKPCIAYCALGDNQPFLMGLREGGFALLEIIQDWNHASPNIANLQACLERNPGAHILCTYKDYVKFRPMQLAKFPIFPVVGQISLGPQIVTLIEDFRLHFTPSNLVDYP